MSGVNAASIEASNRFSTPHSSWSTTSASTAPGHYDGVGTWTLTNNNLTISVSPSAATTATGKSIMGSGKWYFEYTVITAGVGGIGIALSGVALTSFASGAAGAYQYFANGTAENAGTAGTTLPTYLAGDVIGVAFDNITGAIWYSKNGTWLNSSTITEIQTAVTTHASATGISAGSYYAAVSTANGIAISGTINHGGSSFVNACPAGFTGLY